MSLILNIETATKNCSVSLCENGKIVALHEIAEQNFSHAEKLHVFIEQLFLDSKLEFSQLAAVAVSQGPGSYTGLRIGVSTAKGLCYALSVPLIAVDTLEVLARKIKLEAISKNDIIIPMIDARRMEVFSAFFDCDFNKIRATKAEIIDSDTYKEITETIHLIGDGAMKCKEVLNEAKFQYYPHLEFPSAKEMATISYQKFINNQFEDVAYFEPFYLKDFVLQTKKGS